MYILSNVYVEYSNVNVLIHLYRTKGRFPNPDSVLHTNVLI